MKAKNVTYISDYLIRITFGDGVSGVIDLSDIVKKGVFKVLEDNQLFSKVRTSGNTIYWSDELEIDALAIYLEISGKKIEDILNPTFSHAAN